MRRSRWSYSLAACVMCGILGLAMMTCLAATARAETGVQWTKITDSAPWGIPSKAAAFNNKLWLTWDQSYSTSTLWQSSDGRTWTQNAAWPPVGHRVEQLTTFKGKLWAQSYCWFNHKNYLWTSADGLNWTITRRDLPYLEVLTVHNNQLWALGGYDIQPLWQAKILSSNDGVTWTVATDNLPTSVSDRYYYPMVSFKGKLWIMGGEKRGGGDQLNDIWNSADGKQWTLVTAKAPWRKREQHTAFAFDGKLWVMGGYSYDYSGGERTTECQDVWSSTDGITWIRLTLAAPWREPRKLAWAIMNNQIWVMDFFQDSYRKNHQEVWMSWLPPGAPVIADVGDTTLMDGDSYVNKKVNLLQGTKPVTWSLPTGPNGMTIDLTEGLVSWPKPVPSDTPYRIRVRATNTLGSDETSWSLTVNAQPPPVISGPLFSAGNQTSTTWTSVPNISGYTLQRAANAGFSPVLETLTLSTTTLGHRFRGLADGTTYWYRVRGNKINGLTSVWSKSTSCTQDASAPKGTVMAASRSRWPLAGAARLNCMVYDPGAHATGLKEMRYSLDQKKWSAWQPFAPALTAWVGRTGTQQIWVEIRDLVGNATRFTAMASVGTTQAAFVDNHNTTGPWTGTLASPYRKIQDAINAVSTGTTVIVAPGTYRENIQFKGKNLVLRSADPMSPGIVKATVIDGQYCDSVVTFKGTESVACQLAGFTVTKGEAECGGGINGNGTHATILNNMITSNTAYSYDEYVNTSSIDWGMDTYVYITTVHDYSGSGGGINNCDGLIENNLILRNCAYWMGLIPPEWLRGGKPEKMGSMRSRTAPSVEMSQEGATYYFYDERDIYHFTGGAFQDCDGVIRNNTFWGNLGDDEIIYHCNGSIQNNIILKGDTPQALSYGSQPSYCCIPGWAGGGIRNIAADPQLMDPEHGDFRLRATSPCIDAGLVTDETIDNEGDPRGYDATAARSGDGMNFDMGADEYVPLNRAVWLVAPEGGGTWQGGTPMTIRWQADTQRTGPIMRLELYRGATRLRNLGECAALNGNWQGQVMMPGDLEGTVAVRATSVLNSSLFAQSPPFTLKKAKNGAGRAWLAYP